MNDRANQEALRVGYHVALAAVDLLGRVEPARTAALGGLDRLAVDHAAVGEASRPIACRASMTSVWLMETQSPLPHQR